MEFEETATQAARSLIFSKGNKPSIRASAPKKFTATTNGDSRYGPTPATEATPSRAPSRSCSTPAIAASLPSTFDRSAFTSAP